MPCHATATNSSSFPNYSALHTLLQTVDEADGDTASHLIVWKLPYCCDSEQSSCPLKMSAGEENRSGVEDPKDPNPAFKTGTSPPPPPPNKTNGAGNEQNSFSSPAPPTNKKADDENVETTGKQCQQIQPESGFRSLEKEIVLPNADNEDLSNPGRTTARNNNDGDEDEDEKSMENGNPSVSVHHHLRQSDTEQNVAQGALSDDDVANTNTVTSTNTKPSAVMAVTEQVS